MYSIGVLVFDTHCDVTNPTRSIFYEEEMARKAEEDAREKISADDQSLAEADASGDAQVDGSQVETSADGNGAEEELVTAERVSEAVDEETSSSNPAFLYIVIVTLCILVLVLMVLGVFALYKRRLLCFQRMLQPKRLKLQAKEAIKIETNFLSALPHKVDSESAMTSQ